MPNAFENMGPVRPSVGDMVVVVGSSVDAMVVCGAVVAAAVVDDGAIVVVGSMVTTGATGSNDTGATWLAPFEHAISTRAAVVAVAVRNTVDFIATYPCLRSESQSPQLNVTTEALN
jgi:hypothetical protein